MQLFSVDLLILIINVVIVTFMTNDMTSRMISTVIVAISEILRDSWTGDKNL